MLKISAGCALPPKAWTELSVWWSCRGDLYSFVVVRRYGSTLSAKSVPAGRRHWAITVDHPARMVASRVIVADPFSQLAGGPMKRQVACSSVPAFYRRRRGRAVAVEGVVSIGGKSESRITVFDIDLTHGRPADVVLSTDSLSIDSRRAHEWMLNISWLSVTRAPAT